MAKKHHRHHHLRDDGLVGATATAEAQTLLTDCGKNKPKLLPMLLLVPIISYTLLSASRFPITKLRFLDNGLLIGSKEQIINPPPCSSTTISMDGLCCDRTGFRSDICYMRGDIRTNPATSSIIMHPSTSMTTIDETKVEKIKPYTRKWETAVMDTITELNLIRSTSSVHRRCDVRHGVPAVVFSTGGYTGNIFHEFNDGIIPLFLTSRRYNKQVVFVVVDYHNWWLTKYADVLSHLSDHPLVNFFSSPHKNDNDVPPATIHCFSDAIVGLHIHNDLSINPSLTTHNMSDFRRLLDDAYRPRLRSLVSTPTPEKATALANSRRPKLVWMSREGSRAVTNEAAAAAEATAVGFDVVMLRPDRTTELAKIYGLLNRSDVMVGVHGAAMTHFLFLRPGAVLVQVIPLGAEWAAETYYGGPAKKVGLKYMGYRVLGRESSLVEVYGGDDPVLKDPRSVNKMGWEVTKSVYLDNQKVRLDIPTFRRRLMRVYMYCVARRRRGGD